MANKKKMEVEAAVRVTGAEKAEQQLDNLHKKGSEDILIDIKADTGQIKGIRDSLSDVKTDIRNIEQAFGRSIDKIKSKSGKVEFSNIRQSLVDITESLNTIDEFVSGINFKELGIDQIPKLATALDEIHTTIKGISRDLNFDKIRPFEDVQKDIENSNSALKVANKEANKLKLIQRELRKESGGIYKSFFEDENAPDNLNQYIVKLKEFLRLGGDIDKLQFDVEIKDNYTQEVEKVKRSLRDIKEQLEVSGIDISFFDEFKGANNAIENVKILTSKIKGLEEELDRAEAKGKRDIKVNIDDSSIKALSDTLSELTNTFKIEEGSTIGFKTEDIEKITGAFTELKTVITEIRDIISKLDFSKIKPLGEDTDISASQAIEQATDAMRKTELAEEQTETQAEELGAALRETGQQGETAGEHIAKGMQEAREEAEKTVLSFNKVAEAVRKVSEEFVNSRRYSLGARDLSLDDVTWDGGTYSPKKNRPDSGLVRGIREDDLFSNIRNQYSLYTKMQTAFKNGNINESELQDAANEFKNVVVSNFVAAFRRNADKSLLYDIQNSLPKKIFPVIEEYIRDAQTFIHEYDEFAEKFRQLKDSNGLNSQIKLIELGKGINTRENQISEDSLFAEAVPKFEDASDDLTRYLATNYSNLSDFEATLKDVCKILGVEIPKTTERASEAIREVGNENNLLSDKTPDLFEENSGQLAFIENLTHAEEKLGETARETGEQIRKANDQIEGQMSFTDLMHTVDGTFIKDTHQGEYKPQEALLGIQKTNEALQETQQQARLTATELERINTAFQKDTHTTNEDSLIPRETVSVAREVNNTLEQTEDITKRIPGNVEETALALRETGQQARSAAEEIEQAFRADIDQKSKDNMIPTETLPAVREINDAFEQTGEIGTTALVRIDSEAENTIGIFKRLADVVENIFRIASTSDNIIDLDESQYRFVDAEESQYRPTDTADSVRGLIEEKTQMDNVGEAASKTAKKKREFAEANQSVLASIKESLKGLNGETEAFNALNNLIKTMGKNSEMDNTIKGLKAIENLLSSPLDDNSMVSAIKELAAQGDVLKDVANVLKNASKQKLANAKESLKGDTEKVDKKAQREKEKAEKEKLKAIEKAQTQEIKNQNKLYNESIRLLEQIDKLKLKNLSLSPTSDAYIKNEHDIRKKENQYNDNLDKLDLQKRADLTAELRQKNDQYNDSLAETARTMAEVNAQSLEKSLEKLNDARIISFNDRIEQMIKNLRSVDSAVSFNNLKSELNELVGDINKKFDYIKKSAGKLFTDVDIGKWSDKLQKEILDSVKVMPKLKEEAQEVFDELQKLKESKIDLSTEEAQNHLKELKDSFDKVLGKKKLDEYKAASADTISKLNIKIDEFVKKNTAMGHDFQERFKNLKLKWDAATSIEEVKKLEVEFNKLKSEVYEADKTGASFFDTLRQRAMGVNAQLIGQYLSLQDMIRYTRQALSTILELDTALVDLKKTTTMSSQDLEEFYLNSNDVAKQTGVTTQEIISQAAAWSRLKILGLLYGNI